MNLFIFLTLDTFNPYWLIVYEPRNSSIVSYYYVLTRLKIALITCYYIRSNIQL